MNRVKRTLRGWGVACAAFAMLPAASLASSAQTPNVTRHGGPVVAGHIHVYVVFWESHAVDQKYDQRVHQFLSDLDGSPLVGSLREYSGPRIGGGSMGAPGPAVTVNGVWHDKRDPLPKGPDHSPAVQQAVLKEL